MARRPHPNEERDNDHGEHEHAHAHKKSVAGAPEAQTLLLGIILFLATIVVITSLVNTYFLYQLMHNGAITTTGGTATPTQQEQRAEAATPQVTKSDKPKVELFIMSYCPYGLQMQKAYIPVAKLLGSKAEMSVKWVPYAMHGEKELQENIRQYCIQKEQASKYLAYATCFVASTDTAACQKSAGIDAAKLQSCYDATDKRYNITAGFKDQTTWLSGRFPQINIDKAAATQYGVQGSPTLVINGKQVNVARSAEALKQAICAAFNTPPKECQTALSSASEAPGAGAIGAGATPADAGAEGGCG